MSPSTPNSKATQSSSARKKIVPYSRKASRKTAAPKVNKDNTTPEIPKEEELPDPVPMDDKPSLHPTPATQSTDSNVPKHGMHSTLNSSFTPEPAANANTIHTDKEIEPKAGFTPDSSGVASYPYPGNSTDDDIDSEVSLNEPYEEIPIAKQPIADPHTERTVRCVRAFLDNKNDKHHIALPSVRLKDHTNFEAWNINVELKLRMHQVWPLVGGFGRFSLVPLDVDHELYVWYERMVDVAISIIYASVSPEIREVPCFKSIFHTREPEDMILHLYAHYGGDSDSDSDDDCDDC
jgi:hypothetical protein